VRQVLFIPLCLAPAEAEMHSLKKMIQISALALIDVSLSSLFYIHLRLGTSSRLNKWQLATVLIITVHAYAYI
jgi:heme/copper-type cytochrome/quinol oxidase subunit 4